MKEDAKASFIIVGRRFVNDGNRYVNAKTRIVIAIGNYVNAKGRNEVGGGNYVIAKARNAGAKVSFNVAGLKTITDGARNDFLVA